DRLVEPAFAHGPAVELDAVARDVVALHVHEEGPSRPRHLERRLLAGAGADDRRVGLGVGAGAEPGELELPEPAAMLVGLRGPGLEHDLLGREQAGGALRRVW